MELTPAQRAQVRKRSRVDAKDPLDDELNIVPFLDIVINLIMFLLMVTTSIASYTQVSATLPDYGPPVPDQGRRNLNLSVLLGGEGVRVTSSLGHLRPGCESFSSESAVTVSASARGHNWARLSDCLAQAQELADARGLHYRGPYGNARITISAEPLVAYQDLISAMDAARSRNGQALFRDVRISAGVR
ncbi:MAG: biopolymer transporter ExbD [Myxococcota bacterium]